MTDKNYYDFDDADDFDGDELLPFAMAAQLDRFEEKNGSREREKIRRQRRSMKVREGLENWRDNRRMREEIDYLD